MAAKDREHLLKLIKHVKELKIEEEKSLLRQRTEGQLLKFTNVVKGYQYRWFVIDPDTGTIEYYEKEDHKRLSKPRGVLNLIYASICPSDEDSQTFAVNAANGDLLRLRAAGPKERQHWVNRLRAVAEYHSDRVQNCPPIATLSGTMENGANYHTIQMNKELSNSRHLKLSDNDAMNNVEILNTTQADVIVTDVNTFPIFCPGRPSDPRAQLGELFRQLEQEAQALSATVDSTPIYSPEIANTFKSLLLSKVTSQAALTCLKRCVELVKRQDSANASENGLHTRKTTTSTTVPISAHNNHHITQKLAPLSFMYSLTSVKSTSAGANWENSTSSSIDKSGNSTHLLDFPPPIKHIDFTLIDIPKFDDESVQRHDFVEPKVGLVEEHKTIILHLLSQLKSDMDLTKVALPTFILEKRSLLEMFADYMAHPDLFISITDATTAEERIIAFVKWFMTTFHTGHKDTVARKPYNPIVGETFHCSWLISADTSICHTTSAEESTITPICIRYCAEQVSHYPPVTAIHFSCPARRMQLTASIHTKSKFQGLSISASLLGKFVLKLGEHGDEEYHFSLPTAYARSILTTPWIELGGKVFINCPQTGCSANINFHTKPTYGDRLHHIEGEVYGPPMERAARQSVNSIGNVNCSVIARLSGEWNRKIDFDLAVYNNGSIGKCSIDVTQLPTVKKRVRTLTAQQPEESQCLWQHVTVALAAGHTDVATEKKRELEDQQRVSEKYRLNHRFAYPVKYFTWEENAWVFKSHLKQDIQYRSESRTV